jgi:hypothetical protein
MATYDAHANFAYSTLTNAPGTAGTSFTVQTGDGAKFPAAVTGGASFNATVWPANAQPLSTTAEIVTVTNVSTDTFTVTRTQEGSTNQNISTTGWQIAATITEKTITDIESNVPADVTLNSFQNRVLGASSGVIPGQNSLWLTPFFIPPHNYISASSIVFIHTFSGQLSRASSERWGQTIRWALYSNNTSDSTRVDSWISNSMTASISKSGVLSITYAFDGVTGSSAGTNIITRDVYGVRKFNFIVGSSIPPGLYVWAFAQSTSTAGQARVMSATALGVLFDNPLPIGMNTVGAATATSIGFVEAGTYSATTGAMPSSIGLSQIRQRSNQVPYFKAGAV